MTSDGEALFRAICEEPWEDGPRLAYADWLDETGWYNGRHDPDEARLRAAYIRHEIAFIRQNPDAVRSHLALMKSTFAGCLERWRGQLPVLKKGQWGHGWYRGFPMVLTFNSVKAFREQADEAFPAAPVSVLCVQRITVRTLPDLLESEYLRRVEWFRPVGQVGDDGVAQIARCRRLCNLTDLILSDVGMTDEGMNALARATVFDRLRMLHFGGNRVTDSGAYALLESITLNMLKEISWHPNPLTAVAVGALRQKFHDRYTGDPGG
jgi:uncharacterized protein (TIGR02996 family)